MDSREQNYNELLGLFFFFSCAKSMELAYRRRSNILKKSTIWGQQLLFYYAPVWLWMHWAYSIVDQTTDYATTLLHLCLSLRLLSLLSVSIVCSMQFIGIRSFSLCRHIKICLVIRNRKQLYICTYNSLNVMLRNE